MYYFEYPSLPLELKGADGYKQVPFYLALSKSKSLWIALSSNLSTYGVRDYRFGMR